MKILRLAFIPHSGKGCQKVQPGLIICLFCLGNNMLSSPPEEPALCKCCLNADLSPDASRTDVTSPHNPQHIVSLSEASFHYPFLLHSHHPHPHPQASLKGQRRQPSSMPVGKGKMYPCDKVYITGLRKTGHTKKLLLIY